MSLNKFFDTQDGRQLEFKIGCIEMDCKNMSCDNMECANMIITDDLDFGGTATISTLEVDNITIDETLVVLGTATFNNIIYDTIVGETATFNNIICETIQAGTATFVGELKVSDALIDLAIDNNTDTLNIGYIENWNDGTKKYSGLIRSKDDKRHYLIEGTTTQPTPNSNITSEAKGDLEVKELFSQSITNGGYVLPLMDGTPNQIIQTDGAGNLSFEDIPIPPAIFKLITGASADIVITDPSLVPVNANFRIGNNNNVVIGENCVALGGRNNVILSYQNASIGGEDLVSYSDNSLVCGKGNQTDYNCNAGFVGGYKNIIQNSSKGSIALGIHTEVNHDCSFIFGKQGAYDDGLGVGGISTRHTGGALFGGNMDILGDCKIDLNLKVDGNVNITGACVIDTNLNVGNKITGNTCITNGTRSMAIGNINTANANYSFAHGNNCRALGVASHAEGNNCTAEIGGDWSHVEGRECKTNYTYCHAEGYLSFCDGGDYSHAEGVSCRARGVGSHSEGQATTSSNQQSHSEGYLTHAQAGRSHAEGRETQSDGAYSHVEGYKTNTTISGLYAHAEGFFTIASGLYSHAEGYGDGFNNYVVASGTGAHAEGYLSVAAGEGSRSAGYGTIANGKGSFAAGLAGHANHEGSFVWGNAIPYGGSLSASTDSRYERGVLFGGRFDVLETATFDSDVNISGLTTIINMEAKEIDALSGNNLKIGKLNATSIEMGSPSINTNILGSLKLTNGIILNRREILFGDSPYSVEKTDYILGCDTTAGAITLNLIDITPLDIGRVLVIKDEGGQASIKNINIVPNGTETIDGATGSLIISANYTSVSLYASSLTNWSIF